MWVLLYFYFRYWNAGGCIMWRKTRNITTLSIRPSLLYGTPNIQKFNAGVLIRPKITFTNPKKSTLL